MSSSLIGRKLGQYEVTALIGSGGMATVYKGYQASVGRDVAIKVLPPHPGLDPQFIQRFELEAKTIGGLQHPHILTLFDYGNEDDILYLVMSFVDGGTLEDLIDSGPIPPKRVEKILREIASALDYAHRRGVIHRDIKPGNILVDAEGHSMLADFGIVKMTGGAGNLTGTGVVGTPAYMAPEQGQGMALDGRADIYALGVVIFEMLTGRQPYRADTPMQVILKHITDPIPDLLEIAPDLPDGLSVVMDKVLAKDPDERYESAVEFAEDFSRALHGSDASLAAVKSQYPLDREQAPTKHLGAAQTMPTPQEHQPTPTVIMQTGSSPILILAGFGVIALVILVVALVLINQNNPPAINNTDANATGTAVALAAIPEETRTPTSTPEPIPTALPSFGQLRFNNSGNNFGNVVNLSVNKLQQPAGGETYAAWLVNTESNDVLLLGAVNVDSFGDGLLIYTDEDSRLLPAFYNSIVITSEATIGEIPEDTPVYEGKVPIEIADSLKEIFIESDDGLNGGSLVEGARTEAGFAAQHAGLAANSPSVGGMRTHIEHTINILKGTTDDYTGSGSGANPGRKVGVYFFLDAIEERLANAVEAPGASPLVGGNVETIRVCVENARLWSDRIIELELEMLEEEEDIANVAPQAAEATHLAEALKTGLDANENGTIEPFENECALDQLLEFSTKLGDMPILEVSEGS